MLVVMNVVHKRVIADLGPLATLAFKSYRHFRTLLIANHSDIIVSKNQTRRNVIFIPFLDLYLSLGHMSVCIH